jgi:hypothetical protein
MDSRGPCRAPIGLKVQFDVNLFTGLLYVDVHHLFEILEIPCQYSLIWESYVLIVEGPYPYVWC